MKNKIKITVLQSLYIHREERGVLFTAGWLHSAAHTIIHPIQRQDARLLAPHSKVRKILRACIQGGKPAPNFHFHPVRTGSEPSVLAFQLESELCGAFTRGAERRRTRSSFRIYVHSYVTFGSNRADPRSSAAPQTSARKLSEPNRTAPSGPGRLGPVHTGTKRKV